MPPLNISTNYFTNNGRPDIGLFILKAFKTLIRKKNGEKWKGFFLKENIFGTRSYKKNDSSITSSFFFSEPRGILRAFSC